MAFTNTSEGQIESIEWDFGDGTTSTEQSPDHVYTIAGTYTVKLMISGQGGTDTVASGDPISVEAGPPTILEIFPSSAALVVQESKQFTAVAKDEFGNVAPIDVTWAIAREGGSITDRGLFTADTMAGAFADIVTATLEVDTDELVDTASVIVEPGPVANVVLEPTEVTVDIGTMQPFRFKVFDEFGNDISDVLTAWAISSDLGQIDSEGVLTAGTKAGNFSNGINLEVVKGAHRGSAKANITIEPDPLARIELDPKFAVVERTTSQGFSAAGFDKYGNEISEIAFLWKATGGEITQEGLLTVGMEPGSYEVNVSATSGGLASTASSIVAIPPVWIPVGNLVEARSSHTTTLLPDGKVLIVGGTFPIAELYDPLTRTFSPTGDPLCNHWGDPTATLLSDGGVLITGGNGDLRCAEVYNSKTGVFARVGELNADHWGHTATLLTDGRVLIAGGYKPEDNGLVSTPVAELYYPATQTFNLTGSLNLDRTEHAATLLPSGQVFIIGGHSGEPLAVPFGSPELYDPATATFRLARGAIDTYWKPTATALNNGEVLIAENGRAEVYDPTTGAFRETGPLLTFGGGPTATLLPNGRVLIAGGWGPPPERGLSDARIYDPATGTFSATDGMSEPRTRHTATLLANGQVLVVGGRRFEREPIGQTTAELYIPNSLVSYWPADGNANDIVGGNNGTFLNGRGFADGVLGQAFSFDGVNDYVEVPDSAKLDITDEITIDFWMKRAQMRVDQIEEIVDKGDCSPDFGVNSGYSVSLSRSRAVTNAGGQGTGLILWLLDGVSWIQSTKRVDDGRYHHIAVTYDSSTGAQRIYIDGQLDIQFNVSGGTKIITNDLPLEFGRAFACGDSRFYQGILDEVRIYNRALSADEIKAQYEAVSPGS